jgi:hypothetical protein
MPRYPPWIPSNALYLNSARGGSQIAFFVTILWGLRAEAETARGAGGTAAVVGGGGGCAVATDERAEVLLPRNRQCTGNDPSSEHTKKSEQ